MKAMSLFIIFAALASAGGSAGKEPGDDYSINLVRAALKLNKMYERVVISPLQRNVYRLGDRVSIAILKIFDDQQLSDPATVESFLPLIRESFARPELIENETDKAPRITSLLLRILLESKPTARLDGEIRRTIEIVQLQAGKK